MLLLDELVPELELVEPVPVLGAPLPEVPLEGEDPLLVVFIVEPLPELELPPPVLPELLAPVPVPVEELPVLDELPVVVPGPLVAPLPVSPGSFGRPVPVPVELVAAGVEVAVPNIALPPVPDGGD